MLPEDDAMLSAAENRFLDVVTMLSAWDKYAPEFQKEVAEYQNVETDRLLQEKLTAFRASLAAHHPNAASEDAATTPPNFKQLRIDCESIFANNLPHFLVPSAKKLQTEFFLVLLATATLILFMGVTIVLAHLLSLFLGVVPVIAFNFKELALTAAMVVGTSKFDETVRMFSPAKGSRFHLNNFIKSVEPLAETPTFQAYGL